MQKLNLLERENLKSFAGLRCKRSAYYALFWFTFIFQPIFGSQQSICLNMIVKDENTIITRCLESVKPFINYWVIVDTGSTDGTQETIRQYMKDIRGELHESPWVNFSHNRNEALELAKGKADYILFIDADEFLEYEHSFQIPELDKDFYFIQTSLEGTLYNRAQLIKNDSNWHWKGILHEALENPEARTVGYLKGVINKATHDGNRSKNPKKYHEDALLLEKALQDDPENARYTFYLAQSYRDAGELEKALEAYKKRAAMQGWNQEVFWSLLQIGLLKEALNFPSEEVIASYREAFLFRPTRKEPLYRLALHHRNKSDFQASLKAASLGLTLDESPDHLFVEKWIDDYGLLMEYSIAAYWTGHYLESFLSSKLMLSKPNLPDNYRSCAQDNLVWINQKLAESVPVKRQDFIKIND